MQFGVRDGPGDEDGDEVVATYNVYTSSLLQHQLHVFQFPLRQKTRPYEADSVRLFATEGIARRDAADKTAAETSSSSAAVLSPTSRLTMQCRLDTFGSSSFAAPQQQQQQRRHSHHYALQSHPFHPHCDYAVGLIVDGAVHLAPVSTVQQFTPVVRPISFTAAHAVGEAFTSVPAMTIVSGLAVSDRINREILRQRSVMLNTDAASAKELQYFPIGSVESMAMRRRLRSPTYEASSLVRVAGSQRPDARTEDSLFPPELLISGGISGGENAPAIGSLLRRYASRSSLSEQVAVLLQRCQVLTFAEIREMVLPPEVGCAATSSSHTSHQQTQQQQQEYEQHTVTDKQLLEALRDDAVWIHGVWVSKTASRFKGTVAALREVILLLFFESHDASLARCEVNKLVDSAAMRRTVKEILETLATLNSDEPDPSKRVWRLKHVPADAGLREEMLESAKKMYPQEMEFQRMQWGKLKPYIMRHTAAIKTGITVQQLFLATRRHGSSSSTDVTSLSGAAAVMAANAAPASFKDDELAPIISYIRRLFLEHGVLNKQRAKELVMKGKQQYYPDATNPMLSAALQRCVQSFSNATWVLKTLGEPEVDRHRSLILETALELVNFESRAFNALLEEKRQRQSSSGDGKDGVNSEELQKVVPRVLAEVAVYKQHERLWHLKSGNVVME